jgi:pimeloyl-ACP methyl ester carboxylesterase
VSVEDQPSIRCEQIRLNGHTITYREAGDPSLPVVLLVHGITSSSATWIPVMPTLAEHAHVIAPDLLGHGDSDKPQADYSLGALASGLRDLLEVLGHSRATVVGHSLGGGVAMQFAYQYYDYCERTVLVSSGGLGREVSFALRAATFPGAEFVLPVVAHPYVRDAGVAVAKVLARLPFRVRPSVAEAARGYASLADSPARTAFVDTLRSVVGPGGQRVSAENLLYLADGRPTLILWGALDTVIPVSHAYSAHRAIPGSQLEIFEQSRHFPHQDEPVRFASTLVAFLQSSEPTAFDKAELRARLAGRQLPPESPA